MHEYLLNETFFSSEDVAMTQDPEYRTDLFSCKSVASTPLGEEPADAPGAPSPDRLVIDTERLSALEVHLDEFRNETAATASRRTRWSAPFPTGSTEPTAAPEIPGMEIQRELGAGGMGRVYLARDVKLGRVVALKTLRYADRAAMQRFSLEVKAAARLNHPNIVPIYECDLNEKVRFYTMQFVDGPSARELIQRFRQAEAHKLGASQVLDLAGVKSGSARSDLSAGVEGPGSYYRLIAYWISQVAKALQCLHEAGIWHRDIKPGNLLLSPDGRMMVADFGLARSDNDPDATQVGIVVGSSRYLSPERVTGGREYDHRADIYALGATLYELLTYRHAREGKTTEQVLANIVSKDPPSPRHIVPAVPQELERICLRAMARDAQERYQTAQEMADDLAVWLRGRRKNGAATVLGKFGRFAADRPSVLVAACLGLVVLLDLLFVPLATNRRSLARHALAGLSVVAGRNGSFDPMDVKSPPSPVDPQPLPGSLPESGKRLPVFQAIAATSAANSDQPPGQKPVGPAKTRVAIVLNEDMDTRDSEGADPGGMAAERIQEAIEETGRFEFVYVIELAAWTPEAAVEMGRSQGADYIIFGSSLTTPVREVERKGRIGTVWDNSFSQSGHTVRNRGQEHSTFTSLESTLTWEAEHKVTPSSVNSHHEVKEIAEQICYEWESTVALYVIRCNDGRILYKKTTRSAEGVIQVKGAAPIRDQVRALAAKAAGDVIEVVTADAARGKEQ